jgi:L-lactate dehydrogenase complex protein LldG
MSDAKSVILAAIRGALTDVPIEERPDDVPVSRDYRASHVVADPVDLFAERVADYRATVTRCGADELSSAVGRILSERGIEKLVVPPGLPEEWLAHYAGERTFDDPVLSPFELDALDGVVTAAAAAIALTGTIILDAGPGQGRRALTLVPDYHLCVVRASQIAADVPVAVRELDPARPTTLISGPSATSDIELDRVEGVHGPRTLDVIIADD